MIDSLFSSTLNTVAPLHLKKIKENSPTQKKYNDQPEKWSVAGRKQIRSFWHFMDREHDCVQKGLKNTWRKITPFSTLLEENKHNPTL